jgi:uncharacterized protein (TIGR02453 family)
MFKKSTIANFSGFTPDTIKFLEDLRANNNRAWFLEHRYEYETHFLAPAFSFVNTFAPRLAELVPGLEYEARVDKSLWRLNRDVRFSNNKSPYKTNMGIIFWKGPFDKRSDNPGFYFHLEPQQIYLAVGSWMFTPDMLKAYREALLDKKLGSEFLAITKELADNGINLVGENPLSKPPKGFDKEHPLANYARFRGLYAAQDDSGSLPSVVFTEDILDYCMAFYSKCTTLLEWLVKVANRAV